MADMGKLAKVETYLRGKGFPSIIVRFEDDGSVECDEGPGGRKITLCSIEEFDKSDYRSLVDRAKEQLDNLEVAPDGGYEDFSF
jgi:hypothetical protein